MSHSERQELREAISKLRADLAFTSSNLLTVCSSDNCIGRSRDDLDLRKYCIEKAVLLRCDDVVDVADKIYKFLKSTN